MCNLKLLNEIFAGGARKVFQSNGKRVYRILTHVQQLIEGIVNDFNVIGSKPLYAIVAELLEADHTVAVNIHHFEVGFDERSHGLRIERMDN